MNLKKLEKMNELLAQEMESQRVLGASMLIEHKGKPVFRKVYGSDKEDSIYKVFSMTKPITAVALMMLYEQGKVDLYDPVEKYLPGYRDMKVSTPEGLVDAKEKITIRHCLNMTSGLVYPGAESEPEILMQKLYESLHERAVVAREEGKPFSNLDIVNELGSIPLLFQPGEAWHYGISADVVGGVIEAVTGVPYGEYLEETIFKPLEMPDTGFFVPEEKIHRLAQMYSRVDEEGHLQKANEKSYAWLNMYAPTKPPYIESAGGGLYSTLEDYSHFVQMLTAGGVYKGKRFLGRKTMEFLRKNQLNEKQLSSIYFDSIYGYGYGNLMRVMVDTAVAASNGSEGEYGWDGLPGTYFFVDPKEELMFVYMQQIEQGADQSFRRKMRQIIYGAMDADEE